MNRPTRNNEANFLTLDQARQRLNLNRNMTRQLAQDCGALVKISRCVRIDINHLENYLREHYKV